VDRSTFDPDGEIKVKCKRKGRSRQKKKTEAALRRQVRPKWAGFPSRPRRPAIGGGFLSARIIIIALSTSTLKDYQYIYL
jgi:hypothetical protein